MKASQHGCRLTLFILFSILQLNRAASSWNPLDLFRGSRAWSSAGEASSAEIALPRQKIMAKSNVNWIKLPDSELSLLSIRYRKEDEAWTVTNETGFPITFSMRKFDVEEMLAKHPRVDYDDEMETVEDTHGKVGAKEEVEGEEGVEGQKKVYRQLTVQPKEVLVEHLPKNVDALLVNIESWDRSAVKK
ncbi:hypothetical protein PGT21_013782 [Puccinia graminis f. sp. tritici]|uniref:Uncharacterized protein n=2 Tax=Puccinia graminis f. sp. tritici TaxID=56615 RepID=E3KU94_PUCGT|nr:uncharacterized protein PGTG_14584 [Puccinia graminis f. sp. tritici CRL 75-36-700-3]EFP87869.2 hypothetical protein PGTG_14584 [Puccinia graminis f. sp. tritici CRL 75-36-700-3]KAA1103306.1 hypothetical protein PGT21_013782 [Puccinia graminis f. sp. tritici]KAA1112382.1 hypothetical protein PGTUg99_014661 [Puccinia graminis f. sp. tritici]